MTAVLVRLTVAVPCAGVDTVVILRGSSLGSVSLASTLIWTDCPAVRRRRIGNGDGGAIAGRLAFEGGVDADVAHALRVGQSACASAEAEIGEVGAAEELRSDVAVLGERSLLLLLSKV